MSGSGGFAVSRKHSGDRFYNPPAIRRHQQQQQQQQQLQRQHNYQNHHRQQQQQLQRPLKSENRVESIEAEARTDSDDSTLSKPSVCSSSPPRPVNLTNIDRVVESVTPSVPARMRGRSTREPDGHPFYCLGDLWESFKEWSVYGVGVPLLLNGSDSVKQYYVPSLSGIQLYIDPPSLRRPSEESDAESSRETSSGGSSDCEAERRNKCIADGGWSQHNLMNLNSLRMNKLSLRDKALMSSSSDEAEGSNSPGHLLFQYLEQEQPHHRKPLFDKISVLASQFPELRMYRSCDLLPASWISVAWYPIYRIPMGPTLQNLDASFLTFHSLSTHSRSKGQSQIHGSGGWKGKISLPVFGLASYKLKGSILTSGGDHEWQQAKSLWEAADNRLRCLQVNLPDYQFFISHNSQFR